MPQYFYLLLFCFSVHFLLSPPPISALLYTLSGRIRSTVIQNTINNSFKSNSFKVSGELKKLYCTYISQVEKENFKIHPILSHLRFVCVLKGTVVFPTQMCVSKVTCCAYIILFGFLYPNTGCNKQSLAI